MKYLISAHGHWDNLCGERSGDFGNLDLGADCFVRLHIEALYAVSAVYFCNE